MKQKMLKKLVLVISFFCVYNCFASNGLKEIKRMPANDKDIALKFSSLTIIGDGSYCEVYNFLKDALLGAKIYSEKEINDFIEIENSIMDSKSSDKPHLASAYEGEVSSLLKVLCRNFEGCEAVTLYQKNGIAILDTTFIHIGDVLEIDKYYNIGFLGRDITSRFTAKKMNISNHKHPNKHYYETVQPIYYNIKRNYAFLSGKPENDNDPIIGYVKYVLSYPSK